MGEIVSGVGQFIGGRAEQAEGERAFKIAQIQADETASARTAELNRTLGNINAALAGANRDLTGPTAAALREKAVDTTQSNLNRERTSILLRGFAQRRAGALAAQQGAFALGGAIGGTALDIAIGLAAPTSFSSRRVG